MGKSRVRVGIDREGPTVTVALRGADATATLQVQRADASSLGALLRAAADPTDEAEFNVELRASLTTTSQG